MNDTATKILQWLKTERDKLLRERDSIISQIVGIEKAIEICEDFELEEKRLESKIRKENMVRHARDEIKALQDEAKS